MRQLRGDVNAALAEGRDGPLPVQRLRPLLQDERPEPAADQTQTATRKSNFTQLLFIYLFIIIIFCFYQSHICSTLKGSGVMSKKI